MVRAARIAAIGHGGQVLISDVTRALVRSELPDGVEVRSLGPQRLRGLDEPEPVHELVIEGLTEEHPPLRGEAPLAARRMEFAERTQQRIEEQVLAEIERGLDSADLTGPRRAGRRTPWPVILILLLLLVVLGAVPIVSILLNR